MLIGTTGLETQTVVVVFVATALLVWITYSDPRAGR